MNEEIKSLGLSTKQVETQVEKFGYNDVPKLQKSFLQLTIKRLWGPIPWIIELALIIELLLGNTIQVIFILALLLFSALDGAIQETKTKKSLKFLDDQLTISTNTKRDGQWNMVSARNLVPDDLVHLTVGSVVPADCKVVSGVASINQAIITGESQAVVKENGDEIFTNSTIVEGDVYALITKTGLHSSYGKTTNLIRQNDTPGQLQNILFKVVKYLAYLDIVLALILVVAALINHEAILDLLPFIVILFIATIPVSMPSSFDVANSVEAKNLANKHILVSGLSGIQEAASMNVLLIDKTGTLTENKPVLTQIIPTADISKKELLQYALTVSDIGGGNALDKAIGESAQDQELKALPVKSFNPFDPALKSSKTTLETDGVLIKGSPKLLLKSDSDLNDKFIELTKTGLQVLAISLNDQIIGLLAFKDELKKDSAKFISDLKKAGVTPLMITGDTNATALSVAKEVGLDGKIGTFDEAIKDPLSFAGIANVYPTEKLKMVKALQDKGFTVGMTGDGVNDAPALKQANVGIAISTATDIAKSAARIILTKPSLMGILSVIDSGHRVYQRMMTWVITKLARTAQLSLLLTIGYLTARFFPVSLSLIVLIVILNDCVTLTLGADNVKVTRKPEDWDILKLTKLSSIITVSWLILGFGLFFGLRAMTGLSQVQISSVLFCYLIYSAMATIMITRTRDYMWTLHPSKIVLTVVIINLIVATLIGSINWFTAAVPFGFLLLTFVLCVVFMIINDFLKVQFYKRSA